jgi:lambda family phage portal protein
MRTHWIDRVTAPIAPRWTLRRQHARAAIEMMQRHYEAAESGRRTQGWRRSSGDANAVVGPVLASLRENARDLVRNNPYAESALSTIADHAVGWGIRAKPEPENKRALDAWQAWADSTDCDADGRHDFAGLQKLVMRTTVESGEVLVRRRFRRPEDGFALPLQLQILDPDFLDTTKDTLLKGGPGNLIIQGIEYDLIGRRVAYWLFRDHPGSGLPGSLTSQRIPASEIRHVFKPIRPGQVRGVTWFAPVLLRFKDFDEFEDATLMKQKIAACLAVLTSDVDGSASALGTVDPANPLVDSLEPGMIANIAPGRDVKIVDPPQARDYDAYSKTVLRAIATGLGVTYEDLTGDYQDLPFSAARMSRIRHWARVEDWRWRILIPQFCEPAWEWAMEAGVIMGLVDGRDGHPKAEWSAPPAPMVDPVNEGLAIQRNVRAGIQSLSDALRERGMDPKTVFTEIAADNAKLDSLGIILDSDPRQMTQAGQLQGTAAQGQPPPEPVDDEDLARALALQPRR